MLIIVYKVQAEAALSHYTVYTESPIVASIPRRIWVSLDNDIYFKSLYHEGFKHIKGKPPYSVIPAY